jgi:hypothetical protein
VLHCGDVVGDFAEIVDRNSRQVRVFEEEEIGE